MTNKHTPGPWKNHGRIRQPGVPHSSVVAKTLIARVYSEALGDSDQETANANLISAAPDLLEKLDQLVLVVGLTAFKYEDQRAILQQAVDEARAAIAKATGKNHAQ